MIRVFVSAFMLFRDSVARQGFEVQAKDIARVEDLIEQLQCSIPLKQIKVPYINYLQDAALVNALLEVRDANSNTTSVSFNLLR